MKRTNNNISPLPFYDDINMQNHRKAYAFGNVYALRTYKNMLIPFQVILSKSYTSISAAKLYDFNTGNNIDISRSMSLSGLDIKQYGNCAVIVYPAKFPIPEMANEGQFYIELTTNAGKLYSDIFVCMNDVSKLLKIEYSNSYDFVSDFGVIDFSNAFRFVCYLDTAVGRPEYVFEEELTERSGYKFIEYQTSKKTYKFVCLAPEYLCDALRLIRLCDTKSIYSDGIEYDLMNFTMDVKWQDQGDLASIDAEFETDTIISNNAWYKSRVDTGDMNNDFNNDYKNK